VAPSAATTTFSIISTSGNATSSQTTTSSGTTKGGGARASTSCGPMYLTQLWNYSMGYNEIIKGLGLISCRFCKIFNVNLVRVCEKLMYRCVG